MRLTGALLNRLTHHVHILEMTRRLAVLEQIGLSGAAGVRSVDV